MTKTYKVFCAHCQTETPHTGALVKDEIILTCTNPIAEMTKDKETGENVETTRECGRFVKVSTELSSEEIKDVLSAHAEDNAGQEKIDEKALAEKQAEAEKKMGEALFDFEIKE